MAIKENTNKKIRKIKKIRMVTFLLTLFSVFFLGVYFLLQYKPLAGGSNGLNINLSSNKNKQKSVNILVAGIDNNSERETQLLTDVLMLVNFNLQDSKISVLQIPRDTYVGNDYPSGKVNAIYSSGKDKENKINNLLDYLKESLKIDINHYMTVDMDGFVNVIDSIGGVEMDVPYNIPKYNLVDHKISIKKGKQVLDGKKSEVFVRYRAGYVEGDIGRVKAQRVFISAMVDQLKNTGIKGIPKVLSALDDKVYSDMSIGDMTKYAQAAMKVDLDAIEMHTLPGEFANKNGLSYWSAHKKPLAKILNDNFRPFSNVVEEKDLKIIEIANTNNQYNQNGNSISDILDGAIPGKDTVSDKKEPQEEEKKETTKK
ncbi:MAG: LCP family protein [Oscillospiraceae bacterium]